MAFLNRLFTFQGNPADLKEIRIHLVGDHQRKSSRLQKVSEVLLKLNTPTIITLGIHFNIITVAGVEYKIWQLKEEIGVDLNTFFAKKHIILICPDKVEDIEHYHEKYSILKSTSAHKRIVFFTDDIELFKRAIEINPSPKISVIYYPLCVDNLRDFLKVLREHYVQQDYATPSPRSIIF